MLGYFLVPSRTRPRQAHRISTCSLPAGRVLDCQRSRTADSRSVQSTANLLGDDAPHGGQQVGHLPQRRPLAAQLAPGDLHGVEALARQGLIPIELAQPADLGQALELGVLRRTERRDHLPVLRQDLFVADLGDEGVEAGQRQSLEQDAHVGIAAGGPARDVVLRRQGAGRSLVLGGGGLLRRCRRLRLFGGGGLAPRERASPWPASRRRASRRPACRRAAAGFAAASLSPLSGALLSGSRSVSPAISLASFSWDSRRWCRRPDSNRHGSPHTALNRARLPIPPLRHGG